MYEALNVCLCACHYENIHVRMNIYAGVCRGDPTVKVVVLPGEIRVFAHLSILDAYREVRHSIGYRCVAARLWWLNQWLVFLTLMLLLAVYVHVCVYVFSYA